MDNYGVAFGNYLYIGKADTKIVNYQLSIFHCVEI